MKQWGASGGHVCSTSSESKESTRVRHDTARRKKLGNKERKKE